MWGKIKALFWYIHNTFHDSEVILWSRVQVLAGVVWVAVQSLDPALLFKAHPEYLVYYLIFSNVVNELLRRSREDWKEPSA